MRKNIRIKFIIFLLGSILATKGTSAIHKPCNGFIENKGQIVNQNYQVNSNVLYMYDGNGLKVQLKKTGYSYELYQTNNLAKIEPGKKNNDVKKLNESSINSFRIDIDFLGMNFNPEIKPTLKNKGVINYIINGNEVSDISSYNKVTYKNVFQNIDIEFVITDNESSPIKYNIILYPGANINDIKLFCKGATSVTKAEDGSVNFTTPLGIINENIPISYYSSLPSKSEKIDFKLSNNIISFSGTYDKSKTFIIDPSSNRIWGTYFGGPSLDFCTSTSVNSTNDVFLAGYSLSTSNIATAGAYQVVLSGSYDAYLAKFSSAGVLLWSTYFGGTGFDIFYNMHIDAADNVFVCGDSNSPSNIASVGAHQITYGGGIDDGIIAKFNTNGQRLWSTYYGGNQHEIINGITTDNNGDLILSGHTESAGSISTLGAYKTAYTFGVDVFVAKFNTNGIRQWGTYYGDNDDEEPLSADCDALNNIFISGFTTSTQGIATVGSHQAVYGGNQDGFIAKFNSSGTQLLWGTYYGGTGIDNVPKVQINNSGDIFIAGNTTSPNAIATAVAHQTVLGSADDGFLARFNSIGIRQWGTYFGGNDVDYISDFLLDGNNNIIFCGETQSTNNINTLGAYQTTLASIFNYDAYLAKFTGGGLQKVGTYFGGLVNDNAKAIAIDNTGKVYIAGETTSTNSIASPGSNMPVASGNGDAFLAKFCLAPEPTIVPSGTINVCNGNSYSLTTQNGFPTYLWSNGFTNNPLSISSVTNNGTFYYTVNIADGFGCDGTSDSVKVIVSVCTSINEVSKENDISIYPVPVKDELFFNLGYLLNDERVIFKIYSSNGSLVLMNTIDSDTFSVDVKSFSQGLYFINIYGKECVVTKKFIKE